MFVRQHQRATEVDVPRLGGRERFERCCALAKTCPVHVRAARGAFRSMPTAACAPASPLITLGFDRPASAASRYSRRHSVADSECSPIVAQYPALRGSIPGMRQQARGGTRDGSRALGSRLAQLRRDTSAAHHAGLPASA